MKKITHIDINDIKNRASILCAVGTIYGLSYDEQVELDYLVKIEAALEITHDIHSKIS